MDKEIKIEWKTKDIKALFPIEATITIEDRKLAILNGGLHKLGNILLGRLLPKELHENIFWGLSIGTIKGVEIKTGYEFKDKKETLYLPLYLDKNFKGDKIEFRLR